MKPCSSRVGEKAKPLMSVMVSLALASHWQLLSLLSWESSRTGRKSWKGRSASYSGSGVRYSNRVDSLKGSSLGAAGIAVENER